MSARSVSGRALTRIIIQSQQRKPEQAFRDWWRAICEVLSEVPREVKERMR